MSFLKKIPTAFQFLFDGKVPLRKKLLPLFTLIYLVSPIDFVPDAILGLGFVDDITLATYVLSKLSVDLDDYMQQKERDKKDKEIKNKIIENVDYEIKDEDKL